MKNQKNVLSFLLVGLCLLCSCTTQPETPILYSPKNLNIDDGVLTFNKVDNATEYKLLVDDIEFATSYDNSFKLNIIKQKGYHKIKVKAVNETLVSAASISLPYLVDEESSFVSLSVLNYGYVKDDNFFYNFGDNNFHQLGHDNNSNRLEIGNICEVRYGADFCIVLNENGDIYSFGNNSFGQLGRLNNPEPTKISGSIKFKKIFAGSYHALALSDDDCAYVWGRNDYNQTGNDNNYVVTKMSSKKFINAYCGHDATLLIDENGDIFALGNNINKNIKSDGADTLSLTKITANGGYKAAILVDDGIVGLTNNGNVVLISSSQQLSKLLFKNIYGNDKFIFARTIDNYIYNLSFTSTGVISSLVNSSAVASFNSYKNKYAYIDENCNFYMGEHNEA